MHLNLATSRICLESGQIVSLDNAAGVHIRPTKSQVWVTEEGDCTDFVVSPGEDFVVSNPGRTIVQAIDATWVDLDERLAS